MERELKENQSLWELFEVINGLENARETALFFRDLCTVNELESMAERWEVARMLNRGLPYRAISRITGASTATVTRIAHWLKYGEGGYRLVLDRFGQQDCDKPDAAGCSEQE